MLMLSSIVFIIPFILFAVVFVGIIVFTVVRVLNNKNSPVISAQALLTEKKTYCNHHNTSGSMMHHDVSYYLIFKLDTGSEIRFCVTNPVFHTAVAGEWGNLVFQGSAFISFHSLHNNLYKS